MPLCGLWLAEDGIGKGAEKKHKGEIYCLTEIARLTLFPLPKRPRSGRCTSPPVLGPSSGCGKAYLRRSPCLPDREACKGHLGSGPPIHKQSPSRFMQQETGSLATFLWPPHRHGEPGYCHGGGGATTTGPDAAYPPAIYQNPGGGAVWGGSAGGCRGGCSAAGGGSQGGGACARPTTTTCIPPGGMCVWGFGGTEVCMR